MYSLLVTPQAAEHAAGSFTIGKDRFLEYTDDQIRLPLAGLSKEAIACLRAWPCLLMEEGRAEEVARLVQVTAVAQSGKDLTLTLQTPPKPVELTNDALWKIRTDLDIEQFEFSRNHWAVKDRDLFAVFIKAQLSVPKLTRDTFASTALPAVARSDLILARDAVAALSHADIDDLLMEAGVKALQAGRDLGGKRARADAMLKFALENPFAVTAENSLFSLFLLKQARRASRAPVAAAPPAKDVGGSEPSAHLSAATGDSDGRSPNRVFVVHGRDEKARTAVVSFLESVGLEGIVLHDQPNMGRHLLTKFIDEAALVTFAVVLMTDDDVGSAKGGQLLPRARQNVILELGYFIAHLGQPRVCALISPGLETPSDFDGIVYIKMSADKRWQTELLRELVAAKMPVAS
jgi:predicted nucleotide-binding protein